MVKVTFDPAKRDATLKHGGLDFADAAEVFAGRHTSLASNRFDEVRYVSAGRLVVIVWTPRGEARQVMSMRYCHAKEEREWRKHLG